MSCSSAIIRFPLPSLGLVITRAATPLRSARRSEERRVGKECRSRCDWSSDVCSSDLLVMIENVVLLGHYPVSTSKFGLGDYPRSYATPLGAQIGRASCRERV